MPSINSATKYIILIFILLCVAALGFWHIDLCAAGFINNAELTNGFGIYNTSQVYHLALYTSMISFVITSIIAIIFVNKYKGEK